MPDTLPSPLSPRSRAAFLAALFLCLPNSGRAVCADEAAPYAEKLLVLPGFLTTDRTSAPSAQDILDGLVLSGYFMERRIFWTLHKETPEARSLFLDRLRRIAEEGGKWVTDAVDPNLLTPGHE